MEKIIENEVEYDVNAEVNRWAFPGKMWAFIGNREQEIPVNGLTKRELFSAMAMQGLLSSGFATDRKLQIQSESVGANISTAAAVFAVDLADTLIAELNKPIN